MVKDHLWFGVPMAPTFWMLIQDNQNPTLDDFANEDARLRKRLNKFVEASEMGGEWPDDEFWLWTDANDQTVPISSDNTIETAPLVTRENYA